MTACAPLPDEHDFNPWNDPLDAQIAWHHFGGLTIDQAYARFCENPMTYQEDFMFMGGKAFAYYFPVIDRYLRRVPEANPYGDDREAWILAKCIENQFQGENAVHVRHLRERVSDLAYIVQNNITRFGEDDAERQRVADAWSELVVHVNKVVVS